MENNNAVPSFSHQPILPKHMKRKRKRANNEPLNNGEKESRKTKYMKKIFNDDKAAKATSFQKRKPTLKKKSHELQTLCGIDVCMVCYDSKGNLDMWPEDRNVVKAMVKEYMGLENKAKHESNIVELLEKKKKKLEENKEKVIRDNVEEVMKPLSKFFDGLHGDSLMNEVVVLDSKLKHLKERIGMLKCASDEIGQVNLVPSKLGQLQSLHGEPDPDIVSPILMLENKATLEMADFPAILGTKDATFNTIYNGMENVITSSSDSTKLENFGTPFYVYNTINSTVAEGNNMLLDHNFCNSVEYGQMATSNGFHDTWDPFFQGWDTGNYRITDSRKFELSDIPLGSYNFPVGINNTTILGSTCNCFGFDQVSTRTRGLENFCFMGNNSSYDRPQVSTIINQALPFSAWPPKKQ